MYIPVYQIFQSTISSLLIFLHEVYPHWLYTLALRFNNMNVAIIVTHSARETMIAACA